MSLSAAVTVTDTPNAGQSLTTTASVANVAQGDTFAVALTTTTGVMAWKCYPASQSTLNDWNGVAQWNASATGNVGTTIFTMNCATPKFPITVQMISEVSDGQNVTYFPFTITVGGGASKQQNIDHLVRAVAVTTIAAYTAANGVLTTNATGGAASAIWDGLTLAAGDRFLLPLGVAAAVTQAGPYVVVVAGATGVTAIYARPADWATGSVQQSGARFDVTEGTLFAGTSWKLVTAGSITVDTTSVDFYPAVVTQAATLVSGAKNVVNVPIRSMTSTQFLFVTTTATGITNTVQYRVLSGTAGALLTASMTLIAAIAAGTVNANDTSVGNFSIINQI
jgi:hypothetical protein